jgi:hypothetical protein
MSFIDKIKRFFSNGKCECKVLRPSSILDGWNLQDTAYGCNGDLIADDKNFIAISHTNPNYTKSTNITWKENRVEIARRIPHGGMKWKFKTKFHKLSTTSEWVIFSQLWNREQANVICLAVKKSTKQKGKVKIELNKKQDHKTTTLYYFYMNEFDLCDIDLQIGSASVSGKINGVDVGIHDVDIWTKSHHEIKYGMYWSGKIPYNQANHMVLEFTLN